MAAPVGVNGGAQRGRREDCVERCELVELSKVSVYPCHIAPRFRLKLLLNLRSNYVLESTIPGVEPGEECEGDKLTRSPKGNLFFLCKFDTIININT